MTPNTPLFIAHSQLKAAQKLFDEGSRAMLYREKIFDDIDLISLAHDLKAAYKRFMETGPRIGTNKKGIFD